MEYKLELKPFVGKNGQKYKVIHITDLMLHGKNVRPTQSPAKKIQKAFEKNEPGRIYSKIEKQNVETESHSITMELLKGDPEFVKMVQEEERKGYKVLISFPKAGIPVLLGNDAKEYMDGVHAKRIIRRIDKKKKEE